MNIALIGKRGKVMKNHSDTRDPFLVKQIETLKQERNKERKLKEQYDREINEIATYLGCYGSSKDIIKHIEKYKQSYYTLRIHEMKGKLRFALRRFFTWFVRKTAW